VDGVKRPMADGNEGSTPALGDAQARKLLDYLALTGHRTDMQAFAKGVLGALRAGLLNISISDDRIWPRC
jgi:hypothetical protein